MKPVGYAVEMWSEDRDFPFKRLLEGDKCLRTGNALDFLNSLAQDRLEMFIVAGVNLHKYGILAGDVMAFHYFTYGAELFRHFRVKASLFQENTNVGTGSVINLPRIYGIS